MDILTKTNASLYESYNFAITVISNLLEKLLVKDLSAKLFIL